MDSTQLLIAVILIAIAACFYASNSKAKAKRKAQLALDAEHRAALAQKRTETLAIFASGGMPTVSAPNVVLTKDERVVWTEPAQLFEERVTSRTWDGGNQGVSIPTGVAGIRLNFGKTKGRLNVTRNHVPVASGDLIITTRHVFFNGDTKSSKAALTKIVTFNCADDGATIAVTGRVNPWTVMFDDPEAGEVVREALKAAFAA
jgi:hypothetical protein